MNRFVTIELPREKTNVLHMRKQGLCRNWSDSHCWFSHDAAPLA